jgi:hypothetical protein
VGTRVTDISHRRWTVWVNTQEIRPEFDAEAKAVAKAEKEARTHHHVQVTMSVDGGRPRNVATWVDGVRQ